MMLALIITVANMYWVFLNPELETAGLLIMETAQVQLLLGLCSHGHQDINTSHCIMDSHFKNLDTEQTSVDREREDAAENKLRVEGWNLQGEKSHGEKLIQKNPNNMGKIVDIQEEDTQEMHMEEEEEMLTHTQRAVILKWHWRGIVTLSGNSYQAPAVGSKV